MTTTRIKCWLCQRPKQAYNGALFQPAEHSAHVAPQLPVLPSARPRPACLLSEIAQNFGSRKGIILYLDGVPILDAGGIAALEKLVQECQSSGTRLMLTDLQFQPLKTLARAGIEPLENRLAFFSTLNDALQSAHSSSEKQVQNP